MDIEDAVITAVDSNLADVPSYIRRRDVRMVLFATAGSNEAVWLAVRDNGDFEISDVFPLTASDVNRWHKEQAYQAVKLGRAVSVDEAEQEAKAADAAKAAAAKPRKSKPKTAVAA